LLIIFGDRKSKQKEQFMNSAVRATQTYMSVPIADNNLHNHIYFFDYLRVRGFHAEWVVSERDLHTQLKQQTAASVLLNLDPPRGAGIEWAKPKRSEFGYRAGIIMMTSSNAVEDRLTGTETSLLMLMASQLTGKHCASYYRQAAQQSQKTNRAAVAAENIP
jgi:DNA-binding response OmpR family regulator